VTPRHHTFDEAAVRAAVLAFPYAFRDPREPARFLVCPDEESRREFEEQIKENPKGNTPMVLIIEVRPEEIIINQFAGGEETLGPSKQFLTWLLAHYDVTVRNESGTDLTDDASNLAD